MLKCIISRNDKPMMTHLILPSFRQPCINPENGLYGR